MKMITAVNTGDQSVSELSVVHEAIVVGRDTLYYTVFSEKATKREQKGR